MTPPEQTKIELLLIEAAELVIKTQVGSPSMLQRKLRIGFFKAMELMDRLEAFGIVGPRTPSTITHPVLVKPDDLKSTLQGITGGAQA